MANQRFLINNLNNRINTLQTEINDLEEGGMINPSDVDLTFLPKPPPASGNAGIIFADNTIQTTAATFPVYTGTAPITVTGTAIGLNYSTSYLKLGASNNLTLNIEAPPVNGQVLSADGTGGLMKWVTNSDGWVGTATTPLNMATYAITDASMSNPFVTDPTANGQVLTGNIDGTLAWATNTDGWVGTATTDLNMNGKSITQTGVNLIIQNKTLNDVVIENNSLAAGESGCGQVIVLYDKTVHLKTHTGSTAGTVVDTDLALDLAGNLTLSGSGTNKIISKSLTLAQGGGGNITFPDGTQQSTAAGWIGTATTALNMNGNDITTTGDDLYIYNNSAKDIHLYTNETNLATSGYSAVSLYAPAASGISNTVQLETHSGTAGGSIDNILALDVSGNLTLNGNGTGNLTLGATGANASNTIIANSLLAPDTTSLILGTTAEGSDNINIETSGITIQHSAVTHSSISLYDNKVEIAAGNATPQTSFNFFGDANSNVNIQFCDGTIQTTAYTGTSGSWDGNATTNLNMNNNDITSSADSFYIYNNAKQPVYLYNNDDNYTTTGYGAVSILTNNTAQLESHSGTAGTLPNVDSVLALDNGGTLTLSGNGTNLINARTLVLAAGGRLEFPDNTEQTTAYTGSSWVGTATTPLNM